MTPGNYILKRWLEGEFLDLELRPAEPDARPLYRYRCSDVELASLEQRLKNSLPNEGIPPGRFISAAFCLYASEWSRRQYSGGQWAWEPIFQSLSTPYEHGLAAALTETGLKFWQRPLRTTSSGRQFLFSLIIEGGFPLRIIEHEGGKLRTFLVQVLRELDRAGGDPAIGAALAGRFSGTLPASFRHSELYELVGELLATVIAFKDSLPEDLSGQDPIELLDSSHPDWRDALPLSVDDGPARRLIHGLLRETVELKRRARVLRTLCRRVLLRRESAWNPSLIFTMDGYLDPAMLPDSGTVFKDTLRVRFLPSGALAQKTVTPLALLRPVMEANEPWPIEPLSGVIRPVDLELDVPAEIAAVVNGVELARFVPTGAEGLEGDLFVFESLEDELSDDNQNSDYMPDRLGFLGIGSVSTRKSKLYAAINREKIKFPKNMSNGTTTPIGAVTGTSLELYQITGEVSLRDVEGELPIILKTQTEVDEAPRLSIEGNRPTWIVNSPATIIGDPQLWILNVEGVRSSARPENLRWKPTHQRSWQPCPNSGFPSGEQEVALLVNGALADRRRFVIFPEQAEISTIPIDSRTGSLHVSGMADGLVTLERTENDLIDVERHEDASGAVNFDFSCKANPPPTARLNIVWNSARPVQVVVPFPVRGAGFLDSADVWLPGNSMLSVDRLYGVRGRALGGGDAGARLFADLHAADVVGKQPFIWRVFREEISLSALKPAFLRLFAASEEIDAEIRLEIDAGSETARLRLMRFDMNVVTNDGCVCLSEENDQKLLEEGAQEIEMFTRPLSDFSRDAELLHPVPGDHPCHPGWRLPPQDEIHDTLLIFGRVDGRYRIRPRVFASAGTAAPNIQPDPDETTSLRVIVEIPQHRERLRILKERFLVLATKPDDPDWRELDAALDAIQGRLPLTTLDYFDTLIEVPEAVLCFLAQAASNRVERVISMEDELPFLWALLPSTLWPEIFLRVCEARQETLLQAGLDTDTAASVISDQLQDVLDRLAMAAPMLRTQIAVVRLALGIPLAPGEISPQIATLPPIAAIIGEQLKQLRMECLRSNDSTHWPQFYDFRSVFPDLPAEHLELARYQTKVLDAPFAAAFVACRGEEVTLEVSQSMREYRDFDPAYFDEIYARVLSLESAKQMQRDTVNDQ